MKIKICGLKTLDDALAAIAAGADYLGFNFYPQSPRYISPAQCASIISVIQRYQADVHYPLPTITVGVFVNTPPADVAAVLAHCRLDLAQLSGDEPPQALQPLAGRAFKAFRGSPDEARLAEYARLSPGAPALLLDAFSPGAYGGTGRVGDWGAARAAAARYPVFLAGGLRPENVSRAVAETGAWGVDVASGVERAPGVKDPGRMRAFVSAARAADKELA